MTAFAFSENRSSRRERAGPLAQQRAARRARAAPGSHTIRHLPVLEDGALVALVSLGELHLLETRYVRLNNTPNQEALGQKLGRSKAWRLPW